MTDATGDVDVDAPGAVDPEGRVVVDPEGRVVVDPEGRVVVDALGMPCPRPVIELAAAIKTVTVGDEVLLLADDPAADVDVPVWCRMQRQLLVSQIQQDGRLQFVVRKLRET